MPTVGADADLTQAPTFDCSAIGGRAQQRVQGDPAGSLLPRHTGIHFAAIHIQKLDFQKEHVLACRGGSLSFLVPPPGGLPFRGVCNRLVMLALPRVTLQVSSLQRGLHEAGDVGCVVMNARFAPRFWGLTGVVPGQAVQLSASSHDALACQLG